MISSRGEDISGLEGRQVTQQGNEIDPRRVASIEHELSTVATFGGYARLYGPLAVAAVPVAFFPVLRSETIVESESVTRTITYGTLWETAAGSNGEPAVIGLLLLGLLVTLLTIATFRARSRSMGLPIGIAGTAAVVSLMLITKPGAHEGADLATAGVVGLVLAIATFVLAVAHAVHIGQHQRALRARLGVRL